MDNEITVLDYFKHMLNPKNWNREFEFLPPVSEDGLRFDSSTQHDEDLEIVSDSEETPSFWPAFNPFASLRAEKSLQFADVSLLFALIAFVLSFVAQMTLEPMITGGARRADPGRLIYAFSAFFLVFAFLWKAGQNWRERRAERRKTASATKEKVLATSADNSALTVEADLSQCEKIAEIGETEIPFDSEKLFDSEFSSNPMTLGEMTNASELTEPAFPAPSSTPRKKLFPEIIRLPWLLLSLIFAIAALIFFGGNRFTAFNGALWLCAIVCGWIAFPEKRENDGKGFKERLSALISRAADYSRFSSVKISLWGVFCLLIFGVSVFLRFTRLETTPLDMFSDHAEKLYDVMDVLDGKTSIFFVRNTGREAFQFYFTALIIRLFGMGISFLSLKLGTAFAGVFILPFVYLLGKELGNRWTGALAMLLCGVAYWTNVLGRVALRFSFYPMFTAPALYFLLKGLREKNRRFLIYSGVCLGIGLQGYSAFRIVPVAFVIFFAVYLLMDKEGEKRNGLKAFGSLIYFAVLLFLPLIRILMDMPQAVLYRSLTRIGEAETKFAASAIQIFWSNFKKAMVMPFWDDGGIWVHSIPQRPSLDWITGALFFVGLLLIVIRMIKTKSWMDLCLILSVPLFMMPSIMSIAFPSENPSLNRTGAALIPIALIAAFALSWLVDLILRKTDFHRLYGLMVFAVAAALLFVCSWTNYDLVINQYNQNYARNAWNTKQIGEVIRGFANSVGTYEDAHVVPYPYWVDTRLAGIQSGNLTKDYAFSREKIMANEWTQTPQLFIYKAEDIETEQVLYNIFPNGLRTFHRGYVDAGKDFYSFLALSR